MTINYRALYSQMLQNQQHRADRRRRLRHRLLGYGVSCLLILLIVGSWVWRVHQPDNSDAFPELRRSSGVEVRP
jgi:hypothetical protein